MRRDARYQAKTAGKERYFTGKPCTNGHVAERMVRSGSCIDCFREATYRWRAKNPERERTQRLDRYDKDRARVRRRAYYVANHSKVRAQHRAACARAYWLNTERARAKSRVSGRKWRAAYPDRNTAKQARRRARKRSQLCNCCSPNDFKSFYAEARRIGREVDHITPLALGGLHCLKNLQALTAEQHRIKTAQDMRRIRTLKCGSKKIAE